MVFSFGVAGTPLCGYPSWLPPREGHGSGAGAGALGAPPVTLRGGSNALSLFLFGLLVGLRVLRPALSCRPLYLTIGVLPCLLLVFIGCAALSAHSMANRLTSRVTQKKSRMLQNMQQQISK